MKPALLCLLACLFLLCAACSPGVAEKTPEASVTPTTDAADKNPLAALLVEHYGQKDIPMGAIARCLDDYEYLEEIDPKDYSALVASAMSNLYDTDALFADLLLSAGQMRLAEEGRWTVENDAYRGETVLQQDAYRMECKILSWVNPQGQTRALQISMEASQTGDTMEAWAYSLLEDGGKTLEFWMQCKPDGEGHAVQYYYMQDEIGNYTCLRYLFDKTTMEYAIWPNTEQPQSLMETKTDETFFAEATTYVYYSGVRVLIQNGADVVVVEEK